MSLVLLSQCASMAWRGGIQHTRRLLSNTTASFHHKKVYIAGSGFADVTRNANVSIASMSREAVSNALQAGDVDPKSIQSVYVSNMLSGILSNQQHLGPLVANACNLDLVDAFTAEACCGGGGAALRLGYMALLSGEVETVAVVGVEHMTHRDGATVTKALATASDWETEGEKGETFVSLNGALMDMYMKKYGYSHDLFFPFAEVAHNNASTALHAVFKNKPLTKEMYDNAKVITPPVQLFDASPTCDGAACVILTTNKALVNDSSPTRILSSGSATDILPVHKRENPLHLRAVEKSATDALKRGGVSHSEIDIFELHDAYTIMACLSLENAGFIEKGEGVFAAKNGAFSLTGKLPIATFGGLKARGHPVGATGVYQAVEMHKQLQNQAGANQVKNPKIALTQNIGGSGASVFAHIFANE
eukprot:m.42476 g.42476  ORF g.42476 m.42476 type:complete len:420 (+) comp7061_c0_seq1:40-1299(+)